MHMQDKCIQTYITASPQSLKEENLSTDEKTLNYNQRVFQLLYDSIPSQSGHFQQLTMQHLTMLLGAQKGKISCSFQTFPAVIILLQNELSSTFMRAM